MQIWRKMFNWDRVGLIVLFFIPALWQGQSANPTLFYQNLGDGCVCDKGRQWRTKAVSMAPQRTRAWRSSCISGVLDHCFDPSLLANIGAVRARSAIRFCKHRTVTQEVAAFCLPVGNGVDVLTIFAHSLSDLFHEAAKHCRISECFLSCYGSEKYGNQ